MAITRSRCSSCCLFWNLCAPLLGLYGYRFECELYVKCGSNMCSVIYRKNMKCSFWIIYTVFLVTWFMPVTLCVHIHAKYIPHICLWKDMAYVCSVVGIFVSGTCIAIMLYRCCKWLCFGNIYVPMLGMFAYIEWAVWSIFTVFRPYLFSNI